MWQVRDMLGMFGQGELAVVQECACVLPHAYCFEGIMEQSSGSRGQRMACRCNSATVLQVAPSTPAYHVLVHWDVL